MPITHSAVYSAAHAHWHATFHALGIPTNKANTSGSTVGAWTALTAVDPVTRTRSYAAKNYYAPVAHRENLGLVTGAVVQEVVLRKTEKEDAEKGEEWTATGVRFTYEGKEYTVNVTHEVIVSCGSVQSPQLLELSGIGNPDILKAAGIEVKVNNPNVGENLQEHMSTSYFPVRVSKATIWQSNKLTLPSDSHNLRDRPLDCIARNAPI
jgi:choline dehydrogenase-like flavoprotein